MRVTDKDGFTAPRATNALRFAVEGPGEIVATDNGDPTDMTSFVSHSRRAFSGLCLVIVRARPGQTGEIRLTASGDGLQPATTAVKSVRGEPAP